MIRYDSVWFSMIQYDSVWFSMIQHDSVWFSMIQYDSVWFSMIQYDSVWFSMIQYDSVWFSMILFFFRISFRSKHCSWGYRNSSRGFRGRDSWDRDDRDSRDSRDFGRDRDYGRRPRDFQRSFRDDDDDLFDGGFRSGFRRSRRRIVLSNYVELCRIVWGYGIIWSRIWWYDGDVMGHKTQDMLFAELSMLFSQVSCFFSSNSKVSFPRKHRGLLGLHDSRFRWVLFRYWALLGSRMLKAEQEQCTPSPVGFCWISFDFIHFMNLVGPFRQHWWWLQLWQCQRVRQKQGFQQLPKSCANEWPVSCGSLQKSWKLHRILFFFRQRMIALKSSRKPGDFRRLKWYDMNVGQYRIVGSKTCAMLSLVQLVAIWLCCKDNPLKTRPSVT